MIVLAVRAVYLLVLALMALLIHVAVFETLGTTKVDGLPHAPQAISLAIPVAALQEQNGQRAQDVDAMESSDDHRVDSPKDGVNPTDDAHVEYEIGVYNADGDDTESYLGYVQQNGLPDLVFDYGDHWLEIVHEYFSESSIVFRLARRDFFVEVKWEEGRLVPRKITEVSLRQYLESLDGMFVDKGKDRKDEFAAFPQLQDVFEDVVERYFPGSDQDDIEFVGIMPKREISLIVDRLRASDLRDRNLKTVEVHYRLVGEELDIVLKPPQ